MTKKAKKSELSLIPPDDITVQLVANYYAAKNPELRGLHNRAAQEIVKLRKALQPFADLGNHISMADIMRAKDVMPSEAPPEIHLETVEHHLGCGEVVFNWGKKV